MAMASRLGVPLSKFRSAARYAQTWKQLANRASDGSCASLSVVVRSASGATTVTAQKSLFGWSTVVMRRATPSHTIIMGVASQQAADQSCSAGPAPRELA